MKQRNRIIWNIATNYGRQILLIAIALLLNPFLFHGLGEDGYGLIALVGMTGGLLMLLDTGLAHAIARFVSKHTAIENGNEVNRVITTSVVVYSIMGLIAFALVAVLGLFFLTQLGVPDSLHDEALAVFLIVACSLAIRFPGNAFEGVLRGLQRFDLSNVAQLLERIVYASSAFLVLGLLDFGVIAIACSLLVGSSTSQLVRVIAAYRVYPELSIRREWISKRVFREMFSFGSMAFLTQISAFLENTIMRAIISAALGSTLLGSLNLVLVLTGLIRQTRLSVTNVVMPVASKYEALQDEEKLQRLLIDGSRLLLAIILPMGVWLMVMSEPILLTWIGPELADSATLLFLFALVQLLEASNGVGHMVLMGMGRAKFLGITYAASSIIAIGLLAILAFYTHLGLYSAAIALGAGVVLRRALVMIYMCRSVNLPVSTFAWRAMAPLAMSAIVSGIVAVPLRDFLPLRGWSLLIVSALLTGIVFMVTIWYTALNKEEKTRIVNTVNLVINKLFSRQRAI